METFRILRTLLESSDPCAAVLRQLTYGFGSLLLFVALCYPISRSYFRNAIDETERKRRLIGFFAPLFAAIAGFYGWLFTTVCKAPDGCGRMADLNCGGRNPTLYLSVMILGVASAIGLAVYEVVRNARARGV
jgi:hypothetical protein